MSTTCCFPVLFQLPWRKDKGERSTKPSLKRGNTLRGNFVSKHETPIEDVYELNCQKPLGTGSFGVVVVGRHRDTARMFAIKIVDKAYHLTRIEREIKLMSDVDHANIARLFSIYDAPDTVCFVMDLCTGGHLGDLLSYGGKSHLDETRAKVLITQLVSAVAHLHSRGICHRDIKLQNILMEHRDYVTAQIKLIDFGFATRFVGLTPLKTRCGTPYTTAPEVYRESYDERCDLWSVGVVSYILLSGYRPFVAVDLPGDLKNAGKAAMVTSILMGRYHFDHAPFKKVSPQGINFVQKLLCSDYSRRWSAVETLNSPWLSGINRQSSSKLSLDIQDTALSKAVSNMRRKANASSLGNTSMVAVAFNRSSNDTNNLRSLFQSFDTENCGFLTKEAFRNAMQSVSPDLSTDEIDMLFQAIDVDNDKQISFTEFLAATMDPREVNTDDLSKAFRLLDSDNKGYLTQEDFCRVLAVQTNGPQRMRLLRRSLSSKALRPSSSHSGLGGNGSEGNDLSKSYATGMGEDDTGFYDEPDQLNATMARIKTMIELADEDKDGVISYSEFLVAMGNESFRGKETDMVMSDLIEGDDSSSLYSNPAVEDIIGRRDSTSSASVLSTANRNQISSAKSSISILDKKEFSSDGSANIKPAPSMPSNSRPKLMPALLKKGRSMPFIDANDQLPLSPIHESPHRTGLSRFFGNNDKSSKANSPGASSSKKNSPHVSPRKSFFSGNSPRIQAQVHCTYELASGFVDELPCEDLSEDISTKPPKRKIIIPDLLTSTSAKPQPTPYFLASPVASGVDAVFDFEPPPKLGLGKRWASEGNVLKHAEYLRNLPDEDDVTGKIVNGSPDVERAQKKIEYIVKAVNEVGYTSGGVVQTPRLALSRHNSKIDPKMLENSGNSSK